MPDILDCIRTEISKRLTDLNVPLLYLPDFTAEPSPPPKPCMPIHCTPLPLLRTKKRIFVMVGRRGEDLGVLAYRIISKTGGIVKGSVLHTVQEIQRRAREGAEDAQDNVEDAMPGIVILNAGQLKFSHKHRKAMTNLSWLAMPRPSAVHPEARVDEEWNRVAGNATYEDHIRFVFTHLLGNDQYVDVDRAELYILGAVEGGDEAITYLDEEVDGKKGFQRHRVAALALTASAPIYSFSSSIALKDNDPFLRFLANRTRAWRISGHALGTPLWNAHSPEAIELARQVVFPQTAAVHLHPEVSGGESQNEECIATTAAEEIVRWFFDVMAHGGAGGKHHSGYKNPILQIPEEVLIADREAADPDTEVWVSKGAPDVEDENIWT